MGDNTSKHILIELLIVIFGVFYAFELTTVANDPYRWHLTFPPEPRAIAVLSMYLIPIFFLIAYFFIIVPKSRDLDISELKKGEKIYLFFQIFLTIVIAFSPSFVFHFARLSLNATGNPIYYAVGVAALDEARRIYLRNTDVLFIVLYSAAFIVFAFLLSILQKRFKEGKL